MNKRVSHIFRSVTITFLMTGFLAHLIVPFSSQAQKTAFTRWLDHNVVASGSENEIKLRNTIRELPEQTGNFRILVQQASELIASHQDYFKILVSNAGQTNEPYGSSWLIDQWNIFQNQKSGFDSVLTESIKAFSNWIPHNLSSIFTTGNPGKNRYGVQNEISYHPTTVIRAIVTPLVSGISINAP